MRAFALAAFVILLGCKEEAPFILKQKPVPVSDIDAAILCEKFDGLDHVVARTVEQISNRFTSRLMVQCNDTSWVVRTIEVEK